MARAKKAKRDSRVVMYVRVKAEEHEKITKIAEERGYPHTIASVLSEVISQGLLKVRDAAAHAATCLDR